MWATAAIGGVLLVGGAGPATATPAQASGSEVTVSGAAQFRAGSQTAHLRIDVRGTAAAGSGSCSVTGGGVAAACTSISSVTRGTGSAASSATVVGTARTSTGHNVAFRAVVTDKANPNGAGRDTVRVTVGGRTGQGTVCSGNLVVGTTTPAPPPNRAPVAANDNYTATQGTALTVMAPGVLGNDTDADGNALTVNPRTQPANGTLTLQTNGSFTYTPASGFTGQDSFTYTASDRSSSSAPATVTITVQPPAPQANPDTNTVSEASPTATGNVLTNDTPSAGLVVKNPTQFEKAFTVITINSDGTYTAVLKDPGSRPVPPGEDQVPYTVVDAQGRESSSTLRIFVQAPNRAPLAASDSYTATQNTALTVAAPGVLGNDTDADSDALTVNSATQPRYGTLTLNLDGSFTYTPNGGFSGQDSFTYTATDGESSSAPATVSITVQPPAPQANPDSNSVTYNQPTVTGDVLTNDTPGALEVKNPGTFEGTYGTFTIASDGSYSYGLKEDSPGGEIPSQYIDQVTYTAVDDQGRESRSSLTITIR